MWHPDYMIPNGELIDEYLSRVQGSRVILYVYDEEATETEFLDSHSLRELFEDGEL